MNWERVEKFAEDFFSALGHCVAEDEEGSLDFFAVYLIPADAWYIIPYDALGKRLTVHFVPGGRRVRSMRNIVRPGICWRGRRTSRSSLARMRRFGTILEFSFLPGVRVEIPRPSRKERG